MRHEEFVNLVNDVRTGKREGNEHEGEITTVVEGVTLKLFPDAPTGPYYERNGERIVIDERVAFRAGGEAWED